ncbi:MAG TPA: hypothetical protein VIR33_09040 [Thermopolyspora sp.]|jgi:hypothetical protein
MSEDDIRLEELRRAVRFFDPVPARLVRAAVDAYTFRTIDAELAELIFDSICDDTAGLVRGPEEVRLLAFEAHQLTVEVQIIGTGATRRLIGQLQPGLPAEIDIRGRHQRTRITADDLGRFGFAGIGRGLFGLCCRTGEGTIVTDWVVI